MHKALLLPGLLITVRIAAALVLLFHPSFDESHEFDGWDVARFQEIADSDGKPYLVYDVEYPPGSLLAISIVSGLDNGPNRVVTTHRAIVILSLLVDLGIALLLARIWGRSAAAFYLVLGTPLIFFGLVRFDLWATLLAVTAAAAMSKPNSCVGLSKFAKDNNAPNDKAPNDEAPTARSWFLDLVGAAAIVAGALTKAWPAILILGAFAIGRRRLATLATIGCALAGMIWIFISGSQAPRQVLSLRGATGWHIESIGGSLTALLTEHASALEANAYRIGTMSPAVVQFSRLAALVAMLGLAWLGYRSRVRQRLALVVLGSVAALIVSAPLFSPQFLLWLTPWAAMLSWSDNSSETSKATGFGSQHYQASALLLLALTISVTVLVHVVIGPANLDQTVPALLLLGRDGLLLGLVVFCGLALRSEDRSARTKDSLGSDRPSPWAAATQTKIDQVA